MNLMSIKGARDMVNYYKKMYPNDYQDMIVSIGSKFIELETSKGHRYLNLKDFENITKTYADRYDDSTSFTIDGYPMLSKHDLMDVTRVNIHCPINNININSQNNAFVSSLIQ